MRRPPDHQPGDEEGDDGEEQHAVETRADAAEDDFAELDVDQRDHAAERREAVMHPVDRTARGVGGDGGEEGRVGDAEADLLALHVAARLRGAGGHVDMGGGESRVACRFGPIDGGDPGEEEDAHRGEDRPALALVADHAAEHVGERRAEREDQHELDEIGQRRRVLIGVRRIGVEEAAAIGAHHLDHLLRGDRALRNRLLGALERRGVDIGGEILRHPLPDEDKTDDDGDRQQDIKHAARQIGPEIADGLRRAAHEAADQRDGQRDAGRRRDEIVHRQPGHLGEIAHRALGRVGLPVGVGDEADRGIERGVGRDLAQRLRVERQHGLQPLQRVEDQESEKAEGQHGDAVGRPMLLDRGIDSGDAVENALDRAEDRMQECPLAGEDAGHPAAQRFGQQDDDDREDGDLDPAVDCHGSVPKSVPAATGRRPDNRG